MPPKTSKQWIVYKNAGENAGDEQFRCNLTCMQCVYKIGGRQCKRQVCEGIPYCWQHMRVALGVEYTHSKLIPGIKGLLAWDPRTKGKGNDVVFKPNTPIAKYLGEPISDAELDERYNYEEHLVTAPYASYDITRKEYVDAACCRAIASLANNNHGVKKKVTKADGTTKMVAVRNNAYLRAGNTLVTTANIRNGQEIFVDYGDEYWKTHLCYKDDTTNDLVECVRTKTNRGKRLPHNSKCQTPEMKELLKKSGYLWKAPAAKKKTKKKRGRS